MSIIPWPNFLKQSMPPIYTALEQWQKQSLVYSFQLNCLMGLNLKVLSLRSASFLLLPGEARWDGLDINKKQQDYNNYLISQLLITIYIRLYLKILRSFTMSFRNYITSLRGWLKGGECSRFVLGNSGADYDSVVGSLIYAFYMTTSLKVLYLPLIDCAQSDLPLRFQILTVLNSLAIPHHQLLFTNMVNNLYSENQTFVLYDHNFRPQISPHQIQEIVDHHAFDPANIKCNHIISHCGSALTLLYYLYRPGLLQKFEGSELYSKFETYFKQHAPMKEGEILQGSQIINELLYNGILIDTYGLNPNQSQVWTEFDKYAIETLGESITHKFTFDELAESKFNKEMNLKLSLGQQRKKDYKQISYGNFVIHYSTILLDIQIFQQRYKNEILDQMPAHQMKDNELYAFMFSFPQTQEDLTKGSFKKYILFNGRNTSLIQKLQEFMGEMKFAKLNDALGWRKWEDPTGKISRKIFDKELRARL